MAYHVTVGYWRPQKLLTFNRITEQQHAGCFTRLAEFSLLLLHGNHVKKEAETETIKKSSRIIVQDGRKTSYLFFSTFPQKGSLAHRHLHINLVVKLVQKLKISNPPCFHEQHGAKYSPDTHHESRAYAKVQR